MIRIQNVRTITNQIINHSITSVENTAIDATGLTLLTGLIDSKKNIW